MSTLKTDSNKTVKQNTSSLSSEAAKKKMLLTVGISASVLVLSIGVIALVAGNSAKKTVKTEDKTVATGNQNESKPLTPAPISTPATPTPNSSTPGSTTGSDLANAPTTTSPALSKEQEAQVSKMVDFIKSDTKTTTPTSSTTGTTPSGSTAEAAKTFDIKQATQSFEPDKVAKSDSLPVTKVNSNKRKTLEFTYSNIGDSDFAEASVFIKLEKGLKIVPGSIKDNFKNGGEVAVADSVYDAAKGEVRYGPGSKDKAYTNVKVGEAGVISVEVEVIDETVKDFKVWSRLEDKSGTKGIPGILFLEV